MFCQNKKKFDFSSLIFDSRNILAASLNTLLTYFGYYIEGMVEQTSVKAG